MVQRSSLAANTGVRDNQFVHLSDLCNSQPDVTAFDLPLTHSVSGGCKIAIHVRIMHVHV